MFYVFHRKINKNIKAHTHKAIRVRHLDILLSALSFQYGWMTGRGGFPGKGTTETVATIATMLPRH